MGVIYVIKNNKNEKVYIGQTIKIPRIRMNNHRSEARKYARGLIDPQLRNKRGTCSKLYSAMNKYGVENFTMEILEEMDNALLDAAEMQYIEQYDSVKNGYNLKYGGDSSLHCEETKKLISERTIEGAAKHIDNFRKHDQVKGLPVHCVYIKQSNLLAIHRHPKCKWKSFSIKKYGSVEQARAALLEFINTLD